MERAVTVAVVDGCSGSRLAVAGRLRQSAGISVVGEAGNLDGALAITRSRRPEVLVTDPRWIHPGGAEFLRRLAAAAPEAGIVVLTAFLTQRERADLTQAGARAILLKEIDSGALVRTIRMISARRGTGGRRSEV